MPTFKGVVEFLNDRADLANDPFFTRPLTEVGKMRNEDRDKLNLRHLMNLTTSSTKEDSSLQRIKDARYSNCPLGLGLGSSCGKKRDSLQKRDLLQSYQLYKTFV